MMILLPEPLNQECVPGNTNKKHNHPEKWKEYPLKNHIQPGSNTHATSNCPTHPRGHIVHSEVVPLCLKTSTNQRGHHITYNLSEEAIETPEERLLTYSHD